MNWEAIGAVGEILGAIGVIVSLFYVAYQVGQNTKQTDQNTTALKLSAYDSIVNQVNLWRLTVATDENASDIWSRGLVDPESLSSKDMERFRMLMASYCEILSLNLRQTRNNMFSEEEWKTTYASIKRMASTPGSKWFWNVEKDMENK